MTVIMSEEAPYRDGEIHDGILSVANMVGANFGGILTFPKEIAANQTSYICELVKLLRVGEERVIRCYLRDLLQMESGEMEKLLFSWLSGQWQCVIIDCKDVFSLEIIHPVANALLQFLDIRPSYHLKTIVILIKDVECDIPLNFMQSYRLKEPILVSNKSNISSTLQMKLPHQNSSLSSGNCVDKLVRRIQHGKYLPSGIIITGPSGCGKTYLSKQFMQQLPDLHCIEIFCADLIHKEVGETEKRITLLFEQASKKSPAAILLDNIDILFAKDDNGRSAAMQRALSALLTSMDRFSNPPFEAGYTNYVFVIATASNINSIPRELLRAGRLEEVVTLGYLDANERENAVKNMLTGHDLAKLEAEVHNLVETTAGQSFGTIASIVRGFQMRLLELESQDDG